MVTEQTEKKEEVSFEEAKQKAEGKRHDFPLKHPMVILIVGRRGSGKSALAHWLAEEFNEDGVKVNILCPPRLEKYLPSWMHPINYRWPKMEPNAVTLYDDAQLRTHAREWYRQKQVNLDKLITMSRHKNATLIMTTQQTFRIDKNVVASVDMLLVKQPSIFASEMERPFLRKTMKEIRKEFDSKHKNDYLQYTYVISDAYIGFVGPQPLPAHWSKELSNW